MKLTVLQPGKSGVLVLSESRNVSDESEGKAVIKNKQRNICVCVGLATGVIADAGLRIISGDEGNLLVHMVVFLASGFFAYGIVYAGFWLWDFVLTEKNESAKNDRG